MSSIAEVAKSMRYRILGKTALKVSEVGFGGWQIGGNAYGNSYGPTDDKQSLAAIGRALELGCNFFDTADVYGHGHSEELLGQALSGRRSEAIIATKVGGDFYHGTPRMNFNPDYLEFALGKSCERLGSDYIDLYQLHNPPIQLVKDGRVFKTLGKFKASGKIRHYGISIHDPQEGILAMKDEELGTIQVAFNIMRQEAKNQLFREATKNNVGIIAREPLANGFLAGKLKPESSFLEGDIRDNFPLDYISQLTLAANKLKFLESNNRTLAQAALRFVLDHRDVSTVIPGTKTRDQVDEDFASSESPSLTGEELLRIKFLRDLGFS
jgi:aryl-alcohol dehydrogenase-like predicted oxidoreductase